MREKGRDRQNGRYTEHPIMYPSNCHTAYLSSLYALWTIMLFILTSMLRTSTCQQRTVQIICWWSHPHPISNMRPFTTISMSISVEYVTDMKNQVSSSPKQPRGRDAAAPIIQEAETNLYTCSAAKCGIRSSIMMHYICRLSGSLHIEVDIILQYINKNKTV